LRYSSEKKSVGSPLKGNEEHQLVLSFKEQIFLQRELEEVKNKLAFRLDFHPLKAFQMLDKAERGHLSRLEFELGMNGKVIFKYYGKELQIYPEKQQIELFFKHFSPQSSFLNYRCFLECFLP
jgi:hypothetical protein